MLEILAGIIYSFIFIFLILKLPFFRNSGIRNGLLIFAFIVKILAGFLYWYLYKNYQSWQGTSDAWRFFTDSEVIFGALKQHPLDFIQMITGIGDNHPYFLKYYDNISYWQRAFDHGIYNDNRTMIRINAIIRIFSFGHYSIHILFVNFMSFAGLTALYRTFSERLVKNKILLFLGIFFLPSMVFWGSGVSKEAISIMAMGFFLYFVLNWLDKGFKLRPDFFVFLVALAIMCFLKYYILLLLTPLIIAYFWGRFKSKYGITWKFIVVLSVFAILVFLIRFIIPEYDAKEILASKQKDFYATVLQQQEETISNIPSIENTRFSLIEAVPMAFLNSFASPFYLINVNILTVAAFLENILIVFLFFYPHLIREPRSKNRSMLLFCIYFLFFYFVLVGMISPLPGAVHRYRIMALPFLFNAVAISGKPLFPRYTASANHILFR